MSTLHSLVYVSSGVRQFADDDILQILRSSQRNNTRRQVTGMLLYKDGNFLQVLEGEAGQLNSLMQYIEQDERHRCVITLVNKQITERQFPNWSMAFRNLDALSPQDAAAYSPFLSGSLLDAEFRSKPDRCYKLLMHFKQNMR